MSGTQPATSAAAYRTDHHDDAMQGGQTIEQIQKNSGARVQLSRAGEFYPGALLSVGVRT